MPDPVAPVPAEDPFRPPAPLSAEPALAGGGAPDRGLVPAARTGGRGARALGAGVLVLVAALAVGLVALVALGAQSPAPSASAAAVRPAPPLELTDQDGQPFSLASLAGRPVLVFFGYTHCPDVCPATVGTIDEALAKVGPGPRVVFVSIDPERDDAAAMKSYLRYLPKVYTGLSGTPASVRRNADAWGVRYAKQMNTTGGYGMAHTADVFLVDAAGRVRTQFPFGTPSAPIASALAALLAETPPPSDAPATPVPATPSPVASEAAAPSPIAPSSPPAAASPSPAPTSAVGPGSLSALVVSSEVWAGGPDPVILSIADAAGTPLDGTTPVDVVVTGAGGIAAGPPVRAVAVQPWGEKTVYYVATVTIPAPGGWQLALSTPAGATGSTPVTALDQGSTAPLGARAPNVRTPTLSDVGGVVRAVTTQPNPDLRLSQTSTADARAAGKPYVIVIDSSRFRVSPLCGKAIVMVRYLLDRWPDVVFVHLEPFEYTIITEEPVLSGDIANPPLNQWARAYGLGPAPWTATNMPWAFVVDGQGIVRAKYTGIIGSSDIDVIISMIENNGVLGGS